MAPSSAEHRRTHNLLLLNNLINQTNTSSPFTLVLDDLEQTARPLVSEYIRRATDSKVRTVFVSFETLARLANVDAYIQAWSSSVATWQKQIISETAASHAQQRRTLLIFDNLNVASSIAAGQLPGLLSSFINPLVSLLAVYHTDIPESSTTTSSSQQYVPSSISLLSYLATTVFHVHSVRHILAKKAARDRSVVEPSFGLDEGLDGVLQGLGANGSESVVLEMEHRRKSGRGVKEWYVLQPAADNSTARRNNICLLEDHPGYRSEKDDSGNASKDEVGSTFELGLTERQRRDRDGVVLPYFDAQKGNDQGGRILYDMGAEDDFDEEEDEI